MIDTSSVKHLRVILPEPHGGIENMAIDQALLEATGDDLPVLRFYTWAVPTLSLGYFQSSADRNLHRASGSIDCVRRASGGGAIVHDHELTYSLSWIRNTSADLSGELAYERMHRVIMDAISAFGIRTTTFLQSAGEPKPESEFLCFRRRTDQDIVLAGYKIAGSAQRRGRLRSLQHGSILLRASEHAPELPGLFELSSKTIPILDLADRIAEGLATQLGLSIRQTTLAEAQKRESVRIAAERFGDPGWLHRR
jgi:lipoate-protein ligase A